MPSPYTILSTVQIDPNVMYIRMNPTTLAVSLRAIYESLVDLCWVNVFFDYALREAVLTRAAKTINHIEEAFQHGTAVNVDSKCGELMVSEMTREMLVQHLNYFDIPLGEFFKQKKSGNPGFDFFSINDRDMILFGEAKYVTAYTPYKSAIGQVDRFITEGRDKEDYWDVERFIPTQAPKDNFANGIRGFVAAFSSKNETDADLIAKIKAFPSYQTIKDYPQVICVAINL